MYCVIPSIINYEGSEEVVNLLEVAVSSGLFKHANQFEVCFTCQKFGFSLKAH